MIEINASEIPEHDRIVLTEPLPEASLNAGDVGTVVHVHQGGEAFEVEFFTLRGTTVSVATVPAVAARPVTDRDVTHARAMP